jgi:uncharacterized protein (DUF433 family)
MFMVENGAEMALKKVIRIGGDVREHPRYSLEDAAHYLRIPLSTMKAWCRGQHYRRSHTGRTVHFSPILVPASPSQGLLSFYNLAEAHVLRATRDRSIPLSNVRRALEYIREQIPTSNHPLLSHEFSTYGKSVFIEHLGDTINATAHGQKAMRDLLEKYLHRIDRDNLGMPIQIYPMNTKYLAINPNLSSGQPVVKGTRIMASVLAARKNAGESYDDLVQDYGLTHSQIEHAITEYAAS